MSRDAADRSAKARPVLRPIAGHRHRAGNDGIAPAFVERFAVYDMRLRARSAWHSSRILIDYVAPKNPKHRPIYDLLKERRALEKLQEIFGAFRLPNDLTLRT